MNEEKRKTPGKFTNYHRHMRIWKKVVTALAAVVVFVTTYALILPAITMENQTFCGEEEHTHSLICYSNPEADIESASDWEKTFEKIELSGQWSADIAAIAKTQVGYVESDANYTVDTENEEIKNGYSRYGAWYGDSYGKWDAMFVSFCLHYAGADEFPAEANSTAWMQQLKAGALWENAAGYEPKSGDLIFLTADPDTPEARVGIVEAYEEETQTVQTIEGDRENQTASCEYMSTDDSIVGYVNMKAAMEQYAPERAADEDASEEDEVAAEEDEEENAIDEKRTLEYEGEDYKITAHIPEAAAFPEGVELTVRELSGEEYTKRYEEAKEAMGIEEIQFARFFDISFLSGEEELEPEAPVQIEISYAEEIEFAEEQINGVVHFCEDKTEVLTTKIENNEDGETVFSFTQESFSDTGTVIAGKNTNYSTVATVDSRSDGITLNLFDYYIAEGRKQEFKQEGWNWVSVITEPWDPSRELESTSSYENPVMTGINSGKNSKDNDLQFYSYGSSGTSINNYSGGISPRQGIVNNLLSGGYPTLTTNNTNLSYLFATGTGTGKISYPNVNHLFQMDADGYYWYDSDKNYAEFNADTNNFAVYSGTYNETCEDDGREYAIGFFPFNTYNPNYTCVKNFGANDGHQNYQRGYYNHHFGMTMEADFWLPSSRQVNGKDIVFTYGGDDDMWVFIDDVLVLDVGGIHEKSSGTINFNTGDVHTDAGDTTIAKQFANAGKTWDPNGIHTIKMFYLERGGCYSNLTMSFNLPIVKDKTIEIKKTLEGDLKDSYEDDDFSFYLEIETAENSGIFSPYTGEAAKTSKDGSISKIQISGGSFSLKDSESILIDGLLEGQKYRLKETEIDGTIISKVQETVSETEADIPAEKNKEFSLPEATVGDRSTNEFVNTTVEKKVGVSVEKIWTDGNEGKPEVQVQLYQEHISLEEKEESSGNTPAVSHTVTVRVQYTEGMQGSENERVFTSDVVDGGSVTFKVDASADNNNSDAIANMTITSGNAIIVDSQSSGELWFSDGQHYQISTYSIANIKSDIEILVECKSYYTTKFNTTVQWLDTTSTDSESTSSEPTTTTELVSQGILPYGAPITLSADNSWTYNWSDLPAADGNGGTYSYYMKEISLEGYDTAYTPSISATASDGSTVYQVNDGEKITITNTIQTHEESMPVEKKWGAGITNQSDKTVYIALCDSNGTPVLDSDGSAKVLKLNPENQWKGSFTITLSYGETLDAKGCTIREVFEISKTESAGYQKASVVNDSNSTIYYQKIASDYGIVTIDNDGYVVQYTTENGTQIATNNNSYKLPDTGGVGTRWYVFGGFLLMMGSLLCQYIRRYRKGGSEK